ncbi:CaiB/BaiF CoA transferase family protein [Pelagibacterium halotolerans]|uniref:CAIB/BAIF family protein n=1 Tax=Pelagibacterium halotolerans (strain DSM 22347 / JCM 15775 / CGMCC 1.7692 / B2) TaxID=1082931 RepID=G4R753_PELHB|nr:CoA transferase [Pelagibacterium halotolerans]AEQ50207.1 CAIB/BAIF family protein [Pelagibacterium halotolerans B2]QJR19792.1 CoA transferase [Pelagibacterium halotolerans]SEA50648.1 Crotonobetainyl-CoA:carnitine CoA-transferase CaiB [Pelagibacterium halotolerans]
MVRRFAPDAGGPLKGIKVIDLSRLVAGNMTSLQLGDFGAEVIKVEPPAGDPLRAWKDGGSSFFWKVYGRNKRSIALDLRRPAAMEALWSLIDGADVLIENYRPGTLEKMGLGPQALHARNRGLIVLRVSGYGQTGPYAHLPGFGTIVEAMSGYAYRTGFADREPVLPPLALADMIAGIYGASAITTALLAREKGHAQGQVIDLSLLEPIFSVLGPEAAIFAKTGIVKERVGSASNTSCPRNVYICSDGKYLALSGSTQAVAERIFRIIGRPDMIDDPRFATNADRIKNRDLVDAAIGSWFSARTSEDALEIMRDAGATVGPIYSIADACEDTHFREREVFIDLEDADFGSLPMHNILPRLSATPGGFYRAAPELGADGEAILSEIGIDPASIAAALDVSQ